MANRTAKDAATVKGTNAQYLVEKIIRHRIYDSKYWKEECFGLTAELVVDRGMELRYVGGIYAGNVKPTPFLCLALKLLQIQPDKEIIIEFIRQEEYKYIRALGALYLRLTFNSVETCKYLEPLYNDYRKMRYMNTLGRFELIHMDEFIDRLLRDERCCDIQMPRLQKRQALEEVGELEIYVSALDEDLDKVSDSESDREERREKKKEKPRLVSRRRSRSRDRERERDYKDRGDREKKRERSRDRGERRRRSRSRDREEKREEKDRRDDRDRRDDKERRDRREDKDRKDRDRDHHRSDKEKGRSKRGNSHEREIAEANAMREQLGLAPLER